MTQAELHRLLDECQDALGVALACDDWRMRGRLWKAAQAAWRRYEEARAAFRRNGTPAAAPPGLSPSGPVASE